MPQACAFRQPNVQTADEDRKMPAKPSANAQGEVSSTTTGSNTQQQRSGAVVSQGLVLDSEGKPRPHEVRVPFDAPRAYQAFPEDKLQPSAQDAREQGRTQSMLQSVELIKRYVQQIRRSSHSVEHSQN